MHIPVDILSTVTTRTDSGSGVRQRSGSGLEENSSRFERMFEEELTRQGTRFTEKNPNTEDNGKDATPVIETNKQEKDDNTDEALAAGVMGNLQNEVVFILEGDSKSALNTELRIENHVTPPETDQIVNPNINNEAKPEINTAVTTESTEYAQVAEAVKAEAAMTKPETVNIENNINGEVMARMPETRTQDSQNNKENDSKFFENGSPSPLENENEKAQAAGQKDKTYSDAAEAVKSAVEDKSEPVISTNEIAPPLSESIKTVQFQATQQMTQAALNTPVKPENLFQEMISRVEMMQNDTKSAMTIQLNPEFLGKVALEVSVDAAGLHVKINAEDSGVRSMINGQLATLIESLEHKGIEVVGVEVAYTGVNYGTFQDPREGEQQSKQQQTKKRDVTPTDATTYYTTLPDIMEFYQDTGVSSVEYRA